MHQTNGLNALCCTCYFEIVGGLIRPHPGAKFRGLWNHVHHNSGRLAILLAWVNIWLGVAIWNDGSSMWNGLAAWVAPLAGGLPALQYDAVSSLCCRVCQQSVSILSGLMLGICVLRKIEAVCCVLAQACPCVDQRAPVAWPIMKT